MSVFLAALLAAAIVWAWFDFMRAKENAVALARRYCRRAEVQLLDDSVALARVRPGIRTRRLGLCRLYAFEFTSDGLRRGAGYVALFDQDLVDIDLIPDGPEI